MMVLRPAVGMMTKFFEDRVLRAGSRRNEVRLARDWLDGSPAKGEVRANEAAKNL